MTIPEHIESALVAYRDDRLKPGSFTTAVLSNDLLRAALKAHPDIRAQLADIAAWCWDNLPGDIWGSPDRVAAHLERGRV